MEVGCYLTFLKLLKLWGKLYLTLVFGFNLIPKWNSTYVSPNLMCFKSVLLRIPFIRSFLSFVFIEFLEKGIKSRLALLINEKHDDDEKCWWFKDDEKCLLLCLSFLFLRYLTFCPDFFSHVLCRKTAW